MTDDTDKPNNVISLFDQIEVTDFPRYELTAEDTAAFLRVLNHIQDKSISMQAVISLDGDLLNFKVHHEADPEFEIEEIMRRKTFTYETETELYLPVLEMILPKEQHESALQSMIENTMIAIESLSVEMTNGDEE